MMGHTTMPSRSSGGRGFVSALYILGSPSPFAKSKPFNDCFPGWRIYHKTKFRVDFAVAAATLVGFFNVNPKLYHMRFDRYKINPDTKEMGFVDCTYEDHRAPLGAPWLPLDPGLKYRPFDLQHFHYTEDGTYLDDCKDDSCRSSPSPEVQYWLDTWKLLKSDESGHDVTTAAWQDDLSSLGWYLINYTHVIPDIFTLKQNLPAFNRAQQVILAQRRKDNACVLRFYGTSLEPEDVFTDLQVFTTFTYCDMATHRGFGKKLEHTVKHDRFQFMRNYSLPKCGKVYTVGHSLGGALAEIFAACQFKFRAGGSNGHYDKMKWSWVTKARLDHQHDHRRRTNPHSRM